MYGAFALCLGMMPLASGVTNATKRHTGKAPSPTSKASADLAALTLHDRIAQMIVVRGYGDFPSQEDAEYRKFQRWIREDHVGGFIIAGRIRNGHVLDANPYEVAAFINYVQSWAHTPLLVGADFERGAANRVGETASFPYMMAFGAVDDLKATRSLGAVTALQSRGLGVNWVFAPDADVNNNPDNPIINVRSFGEDPKSVGDQVAAFVEGAHSDPAHYVLVTAKHFPGHGDTADDSHMQLARVTASRERLEAVEFVPFKAAIAQGVDSVMTGHLAVAALEPAALPSTLSPRVLTGVLRDELQFKGLIVTDAMEMQGITSLFPEGEAAVRAVEAGADVLLMPTDPQPCIRGIEAAIASGRLSRKRIDQSVMRILAAKKKVGLTKRNEVAIASIPVAVQSDRFHTLAQDVADRAVTLLRDGRHLFPSPSTTGTCVVILNERPYSAAGELLLQELRRTQPDLRSYVVNPTFADAVLAAIATDLSTCQRIYIGAFVTVAANRGGVGLEGGLSGFAKALLQGPAPAALVSLGSPYLLRDYPMADSYLTTFSTSNSSEIAAAKAIAGTIAITGKSPVSIPSFAKIGDGLTVPRR